MHLLLKPKEQELKITESLWQPPVVANPTPPLPRGQLQLLRPRLGHFGNTFFSYFSPSGWGWGGMSSKSLPSEKV